MKQQQQQLSIIDILENTTLEQDLEWSRYSDGEGRFCALGVYYNALGWDGKSKSPPYELRKRVEMIIPPDILAKIVIMNGEGKSFKEIAKSLRDRHSLANIED